MLEGSWGDVIMQSHGLLEFDKLKEEQISRIKFRDGLFYFTMLIIGGALTLALADQEARSADILLALPFAIFIAGIAHVAADRRIDDIGIYIRDYLAPSVASELMVEKKSVFAWEAKFHMAPLQITRDLFRFVANVMLYVGSGFGAIFLYGELKVRATNYAKMVNDLAVKCKDVTPVAVPQYAMWQEYMLWAGAYLMAIMLTIIIMFNMVRWTRAKITFKHNWVGWALLRALFSIGVAGGVGWGVCATATYFGADISHWIESIHWQQILKPARDPIHLAAFTLAIIAGAAVYVVSRRLTNSRSEE